MTRQVYFKHNKPKLVFLSLDTFKSTTSQALITVHDIFHMARQQENKKERARSILVGYSLNPALAQVGMENGIMEVR